MKKIYKWQLHFNAAHSMTPDREEGKHTHSFLVAWYMEIEHMDFMEQNRCEKKLREYLLQYSGQYLNEMQKFAGRIPTIEAICRTIYHDTEKIALAHGLKQLQVEVGDSPVALFALGEVLM